MNEPIPHAAVVLSRGERRWHWRTWNLLLQIREATDGKDPRQRSGDMTTRGLCVAETSEIRALREAFAATSGGRAVVALVHGPSGMGKSALCRHFAADGWRRIFDAIQIVLPPYHHFDLRRPDWGHALPATIFLIALGLSYLVIGYTYLAKRDL